MDKTTKKRRVSPGLENAALRVARWMYYPTLNFLYAPVFFTFSTHSSRRKMSVLLIGFLYAMIGFFALSVFYSRGILGFDSYIYYPAQAREVQLRSLNYDNLRDADVPADQPSIQSDVIEGPYLRLFVPYDAQKDNKRMRILCPEVAPLREDGFFFLSRAKLPANRIAQLSSCFDRIYRIELDGRPLEKPDFVFHRHPDGGVAGRLTLIPVSSLQPGKHLLTVRHTPLPPGAKLSKSDARPDESYIPFWR